MKRQVLTLALFVALLSNLFSQTTYHEVFGQLPNDLNRSNAILQIDSDTYVLGGEWNGVGFMIKVNHAGDIIDYFFLDNTIPGNSAILDMEFDPAGNIIATGECDHCAQTDTLQKVFTIATEPSLLLINSEIYDGAEPTNNQLFSPALVSKGNQLLIAATTGGTGLNFQDVSVFSITANLNAVWSKVYSSCSNCGFEEVKDITATSEGYAVLVLNAFTDSLTMYHLDNDGELLWKKRHSYVSGDAYSNLAFHNGVIYASGAESLGNETGGVIRRFSMSNGELIGSMSIDIQGVNDITAGIEFTNDGTLLSIHRRSQPNNFGTYSISRIYRIDVSLNQVIDFTEIPNPDVLTGIIAEDLVSITDDGIEFAACGRQGFFDTRSFFYSKNSEVPVPPGEIFEASPDTACSPATIVLSNNLLGATNYSWKLDGAEFSTAQNPDPLVLTGAGFHEISLDATTTSQNTISNFVVQSLPEIWNECPICDNKPDPYIKIKNQVGTTVYTSGWVEDYPPVQLSVSFSMSVDETYTLEVWDKDNIGDDDFFGDFTIPGNTTGGNFNFINSEDPSHPLTISFTATPTLATQSHNQTVLIYEPSISLIAGDILEANPGNPAPSFFTWQWYHNGQLIPGAVSATYSPIEGGEYAVAMVTLECSALSNTISYSAQFSGVNLDALDVLCNGTATGSISVITIGGTPPFIYEWNSAAASGSNPTNLPAGDYEVTVTDANGQEQIAQATIIEPPVITIETDLIHPACAGDTTGSISINAMGGTGSFSYVWDVPGTNSNNPTGLAAGIYTVTITDENACTEEATAILTEPDTLTASMSSTPEINNQADGMATVTPTGGTPPYVYEWGIDPPQDTQTATNLEAGTYTVIVVDANGCAIVVQVTVDMIVSTGEDMVGDWSVYPNPTTGLVFIENENWANKKVAIEIHDNAGRLIKKEKKRGALVSLDLTDLSDGIYLISMNIDGKKYVKRVSVVR